MDIVIISEFCEDFSQTDNDRFFYLAKMLTSNSDDNKVEIITSSFRHTTKKHRREPAVDWPFKITFVEEPGYPKNVCMKRFYSHRVWGRNVLNYIKSREKKPDVIYCAVPSLTGPNLVAKYCEKEKIRFVIDVQDLWPEAFQMAFNVPLVSKLAFAPFTMLANGIYKRADAICAVSDSYCKRALSVNPKVRRVTPVFLGTALDTFDCYAATKPLMQKGADEVWLGYCGTLGNSYDLISVIDALLSMREEGAAVPFFLVMGDGPRKSEFEEYAQHKQIKCKFTGRLPYDQMCALLSQCDIVVNPIVESSVASIINKHADYAAVGCPVVNTQNSREYCELVEYYQMGFNCEPRDSAQMAECFKTLMNAPQLRIKMGKNARRCAEERFNRKQTYQSLMNVIAEERSQ